MKPPPPLTASRRRRVLGLLGLFLFVAVAVGLLAGPSGFFFDDSTLDLRLLRVALAVVVGAGLSATGASLQAVMRNPLADPFILGVSGGAAIGGALGVAGVPGLHELSVPVLASLGALAATGILAWFLARDSRGRSETALLVGVVINAFAWALVAVVRAILPGQETQRLSMWLIGELGYPAPQALLAAAIVTALGVLVLTWQAGSIGLLRAGDDEAARLGIRVGRTRVIAYACASLLVGVAVSTSGVIGFIGLIAPHAVRRLAGADERLVVPGSALLGALVLVLFDAASRYGFVYLATELPVGALCALVGAPLFALLLWRQVVRS